MENELIKQLFNNLRIKLEDVDSESYSLIDEIEYNIEDIIYQQEKKNGIIADRLSDIRESADEIEKLIS